MHSELDWSAQAKQFQDGLGQQWSKALQNFQQDGAGLPALRFAPDKLMELQQAYVREAAELWNQGLGGRPAGGDKRFANDAWSRNPVAAFSAAVYLLNARTLLGLAEVADADAK